MKTHRLKTRPEYYDDVLSGAKTFELRRDDRDFKVGDTVILEQFFPENHRYAGYTGAEILKKIVYILRNVPEFGLMPGFAILGLGAYD